MALIPGFDSLEFVPSEIRYKLCDTIVEGFVYDSILYIAQTLNWLTIE